jgi:ABC-type multidrug transport system ATPase subunit
MSGERYIVCGPPGAGKTTWVNARAVDVDFVWDEEKLRGEIPICDTKVSTQANSS